MTDRATYRDEVHGIENLLEDALNTVSNWLDTAKAFAKANGLDANQWRLVRRSF